MEPDEGAARVTVSKILDWYGADFGADEAAVLGPLRVPASGLGLGHPTPTPAATPHPNPNPKQVLGRLQGFLPEEGAQHAAPTCRACATGPRMMWIASAFCRCCSVE